ncbi:MAG: DNA repair protein RecO [candidate division NC10 bacterium]|nr:DNA repair protein RecO [candidate division NC10 bacterium]
MPLRATQAIVIGGHNLGEADRIVVFFSRGAGKLRAVASGARRIRTRFGGSLELFTYGRLLYFERPYRDLHRVSEFAILHPYAGLRTDLDRLAAGAYAVDLLRGAVEEGEPPGGLFDLLLGILTELEEGRPTAAALRAYEVRLLGLLGYLPELTRCVGCRGAVPPAAPAAFSPRLGGLLCSACRAAAPDPLPVGPEALGFLRGALRAEFRAAARAALAPAALEELRALLRAAYLERVGRPPRSAGFLEAVAASPAPAGGDSR